MLLNMQMNSRYSVQNLFHSRIPVVAQMYFAYYIPIQFQYFVSTNNHDAGIPAELDVNVAMLKEGLCLFLMEKSLKVAIDVSLSFLPQIFSEDQKDQKCN